MSVREELDKLLDHYDKHQPNMKGREIGVYLAQSSVEKFCVKAEEPGNWYRGYRIKPLNVSKKKS
jgi:hypothetical protein